MNSEKNNVALSSVLAAIFITCFKLVVGLLTGSLGILSEALHSLLDMIAAIITFFSVKVSDKPADSSHNYGHGKIENLSALAETLLLLITCFWIIYEAVSRFVVGDFHVEVTVWSYIVVITSIVIDFSRSKALSKVAKKYDSAALEADALHFSTDIWSSLVVLLGLLSYQFLGCKQADSIAAILVAFIVIYVSFRMGRKAVDVLLDKAPQDTIQIVKEILNQHPEVKKFHGLKARTSGADTFVKFNLHFDPNLHLIDVHRLCDQIELEIQKKVKRSEVYIHPEPDNTDHENSEIDAF